MLQIARFRERVKIERATRRGFVYRARRGGYCVVMGVVMVNLVPVVGLMVRVLVMPWIRRCVVHLAW